MSTIRLSDHFTFSEFTNRDHHVLTVLQYEMAQRLCVDILEPLRQFAKDTFGLTRCAFKVTSAVRFPSDQNRLRRQGFNPSETSDHLFGHVVKLHSATKIQTYGKYFQYSVGAVDILPACGARQLWNALVDYMQRADNKILLPRGSIIIGQLILEKRTDYWLHISNPKSLIYSDKVSSTFLKKEPFLISTDNGKTYKVSTKEVV